MLLSCRYLTPDKIELGDVEGSMSATTSVVGSRRLPQDGNRIGFCELPPCADPFKEFSACCELKREIVFGPGLKPLVELHLRDV